MRAREGLDGRRSRSPFASQDLRARPREAAQPALDIAPSRIPSMCQSSSKDATQCSSSSCCRRRLCCRRNAERPRVHM
eukprot:524677-Pyramimonas_sp.AAC.1